MSTPSNPQNDRAYAPAATNEQQNPCVANMIINCRWWRQWAS